MQCQAKDDTKCTEGYGSNNCCMSLTVVKVNDQDPADTLEAHNKKLADFAALGYPNTEGTTSYHCQDRHALKVLINGNKDN